MTVSLLHYLLFQRDAYRDTKIACKRQVMRYGAGIKDGRLLCPVVDE